MRLCNLPNGCSLYFKYNEAGGRTYYSDEVGGGVHIWDTSLVDMSTLLAAITEDITISRVIDRFGKFDIEQYKKLKEQRC